MWFDIDDLVLIFGFGLLLGLLFRWVVSSRLHFG